MPTIQTNASVRLDISYTSLPPIRSTIYCTQLMAGQPKGKETSIVSLRTSFRDSFDSFPRSGAPVLSHPSGSCSELRGQDNGPVDRTSRTRGNGSTVDLGSQTAEVEISSRGTCDMSPGAQARRRRHRSVHIANCADFLRPALFSRLVVYVPLVPEKRKSFGSGSLIVETLVRAVCWPMRSPVPVLDPIGEDENVWPYPLFSLTCCCLLSKGTNQANEAPSLDGNHVRGTKGM